MSRTAAAVDASVSSQLISHAFTQGSAIWPNALIRYTPGGF